MSINMQQLESLISRYLKIIKNDGVGSLITAAVGFLNENLKESAFINAVELILIDGVLGEKEQGFLDKLQEAENVIHEFAEKVIEILIIKNRGTKSELFSGTNPDKLFYE